MIQEIWNKLSTIDVNKHTEKKGTKKITEIIMMYSIKYVKLKMKPAFIKITIAKEAMKI